jgi:glycosyltransferase involved in cell wall biosynthesis
MKRKGGKIRVFFTNWVDTYNFNAQSLNVREIALRLNPRLFHSTLFYEREPDPRLLQNPSIHLVRIPPRLGSLRMLREAFRGHDLFFRVNATRFNTLYMAIPEKLRGGAKFVDWLESPASPLFEPECKGMGKWHRRVQKKVAYRIAITEYVGRSHYDQYGLTHVGFIPAGVDTRFFTPPAARINEVPLVLFVGHLIARKNPLAVLAAARRFPRARFVLVGAKRDAHHFLLAQQMDRWKLSNVTFLEPMPHAQLRALMQKSDILFHPSKIESMGKVLLEGGATGLPGLMFDHFQSPAVRDGVTGFQVKSMSQMMDRLGLLLEDRSLRRRMGEAAVMYARQFDWDLIVKQWESVLERMASAVPERKRPETPWCDYYARFRLNPLAETGNWQPGTGNE